jgi:hypothetical protein
LIDTLYVAVFLQIQKSKQNILCETFKYG